jgi:hypothetical protein
MSTEPDWLTDFDITVDDLKRLEEWLNELKRGATLEELTRRIIRGRLRYGQDESPSALPAWVQEKHVLSWDEEEKWCVGCQVLVARKLNDQIIPFFGVIVAMDHRYFDIKINDGIVTYERVEPGSSNAKKRYEHVKQSIWLQEQRQEPQLSKIDIEEQVDIVLLKSGAQIASRIQGALERDQRFSSLNQRWYLQIWVQDISPNVLRDIHHRMLKTTQRAILSQIREQLPGLPQGDIGDLSLVQALLKEPDLFHVNEEGWQIIPPPPPPWEKAEGAYYVYDPQTFEILLRPGEPLKKKTAERLTALDLYAEVVRPRE